MHLDRTALDHRLQYVPLQHLDREDHSEHPERDHDAPVREGDQDGDSAREERAEVRDVRADENQRPEPHRARHPQDQQADRDADGIDQRDERGAAHEALDGLEGPPSHRLDQLTGAARGDGVGEVRGPVGVAQEEEGQQQGEDAGRDQ